MSRMLARSFIWLLLLAAAAVQAHEIRPASLEITEQSDGLLSFRFRQPVNGEYMVAIHPELSSGWLAAEPQQRMVTDTALVRVWTVDPGAGTLAGQELSMRGLDRTITDVLVSISYADGALQTWLIKASKPQLTIPARQQGSAAVPEYLWLGLTHIWSGPDHLLYILGLMLLISKRRALIITITSFTLAHSLTLACAALKLVQLRSGPVEAVISLSIVYVALELVHAQQGRPGLASHRPWLIAFVFGLLHGFGFAGALQQIGLPQQALSAALFLFNIGIEVGQLLFVFTILALLWLLQKLLMRAQNLLSINKLPNRISKSFVSYSIGAVASFWLFERMFSLL